MKKQSFFSLLAVAIVFVFTSCSNANQSNTPNDVTLTNKSDSLSYALGYANGSGLKLYYLADDESGRGEELVLKTFDEVTTNDDDFYLLGLDFGRFLRSQKELGLFEDSTLEFNQEVIAQGVINGLLAFDKGMTVAEGAAFLDAFFEKKQQALEESLNEGE